MAQLVASMSGVVLGGVVEVVGSNLARGKIFTASIGSVDSLYPTVYIYIYINKTRLSPITQFFKHNFLFLYRFHCYTDHQEFNMTLHRNVVSNVTFP